MNELSLSEREDLKWKQKTIRARKFLKPDAELSFNRWMLGGKKRFDWPGWEILCGPKPAEPLRKKISVAISEKRRKSA